MYPGRNRYDGPDFTSSTYLQTNSSYTNFLQQKEQINGPPPRSSWRNDTGYPSPRPTFFRPDYREQNSGWRNGPSWRSTHPTRTESWIERSDTKNPPHDQGDTQRYIAPATSEARRHIAPAANAPPPGPEMWREERPPYCTNWRKEPADPPITIRRPPDFPPEYSNPRYNRNEVFPGEPRETFTIPPSVERRESGRRSPGFGVSRTPLAKHSTDDIIHEEANIKYGGPSHTSPDRFDPATPKRNRILPAENDRQFPSDKSDRLNMAKPNGDILSDKRPRREYYEDDRQSWMNAGPSSREDSWTAQYRKRVETQKAGRRVTERQASSDMLPGPSFESGYKYNGAPQPRIDSQPVERDDYYRELDKEDIGNSSPGRKFFFGERPQTQKLMDTNKMEKRQYFDDYVKASPPVLKNEPTFAEKPPINPNDYVEEFSDDEWNELGALVNKVEKVSETFNNQNRKRLQSFEDSPPSSKKPYVSSNLSRASGFPAPSATTPFRRETPQTSQLSFFREEMPSIRSAAGFFRRVAPSIPPRNECPPNNRQWDDGNYKPQYYNDQGPQEYGYR